MSLKNSFQLSLYVTLCLSSFMLALSESFSGSVFNPQWLTIPLAIVAYIYTEKKKRFHLSQIWVNTFAILAVVLTGYEYFQQQFGNRVESGAFGGAHLLIFLTWIVLFQKKENRQYWSLCVLSGLHVAVGAVLTNDGLYGFLILVYLFFVLWTLTVFSLFRDVEKYSEKEANEEHDRSEEPEDGSSKSAGLSTTPGSQNRPKFSKGFGSVHINRQERWINSRFVWSVFNMASLTLVICAFFFYLIPRKWMGEGWNIGKSGINRNSVSGFADEVQLGVMGEILTSNERALQVRLYDHKTDEVLDIEKYAARLGYDEPLFRGKILDSYSDGVWRSEFKKDSWPAPPLDTVHGNGMIRQEIILEPLGTNVLFAIANKNPLQKYSGGNVPGQKNATIRLDDRNYMLLRPSRVSSDASISYEVVVPRVPPAGSSTPRPRPHRIHRDPPGPEFPTLKQMARQVIAANRTLPSQTARDQANALALTLFLKETGGFTYSLIGKIDDPDIDPLEDFLQRKTGHCEYFAAALTLMLRDVGIPARMVTGYKGGTVNQFSGYFEVQQRHAHAWVEAYINSQWIVLDPTPAARNDSVASMAKGFPLWQAFTNYVSFLWGKHVLGVTLEQQNEEIYSPLKQSFLDVFKVSGENTSIFTLLRQFLTNRENWTGWKGALLVLAIAASLGLLFILARILYKLIQKQSSKREAFLRKKRTIVEFYERFCAICEKMGLRRESSQTQLEFCHAIQTRLQSILQQTNAATVPQAITKAFYDIRFGEISMTEIQLDDIKGSVLRMEQAISDSNGKNKH